MSNIALQANGLTKRYGKFLAVNDLSLEVHAGEVFGFLGPNGAGKTTSINMMCGLLKPDRGSVSIQGKTVTDRGADIRSRIGVCPQEITLWKNLTCLEQLQFIGEMYGLKRAKIQQQCAHLLTEFDLSGEANKLVRILSGGMQRRLNLAMALVHDP